MTPLSLSVRCPVCEVLFDLTLVEYFPFRADPYPIIAFSGSNSDFVAHVLAHPEAAS